MQFSSPHWASGLLLSGIVLSKAAQLSRPPAAAVRNTTDHYFGVAVVNPYRWMERPARSRACAR